MHVFGKKHFTFLRKCTIFTFLTCQTFWVSEKHFRLSFQVFGAWGNQESHFLGSEMHFLSTLIFGTLYFYDQSHLINDLIIHDSSWHTIPSKLPSHISMFKGRLGEDLYNKLVSFHLWCSQNSMMEHIFDRNVKGFSYK